MNPGAATLRVAVPPRAGILIDIVLLTAGAGLIAASARVSISLQLTPVPITGQTFTQGYWWAHRWGRCGAARARCTTSWLLTDAAGFPLMVNAFEGNQAETATMLPTITAADPLPDDIRSALASIHGRAGAH